MNLHSLKNTTGARRSRMRVGRGVGSGKGKTAGRGHKGQMSRKGHKGKPGFEGGQMPLIRRLPKRGFTNVVGTVWLPVNVGDLSRFDEGTQVTEEMLRGCGLAKGQAEGIKILGRGEISKKLTVRVKAFSQGARQKIEAAGGVCEVQSN